MNTAGSALIMSNEQKTGYKYRIGFHQSLTTGVIGFEGNVNFDDNIPPDFIGTANIFAKKLLVLLKDTEDVFKTQGYRLASDIEPKVQPVKNGQSKEEVKR